jgi:hypothetical protein
MAREPGRLLPDIGEDAKKPRQLMTRLAHGEGTAGERTGSGGICSGVPIVAQAVRDSAGGPLAVMDSPFHCPVAMAARDRGRAWLSSRWRTQAPARAHPVEIAIDVELQQVGGVVARPTRRLRHDPDEAGGRKV